jgi:hypothetical protein
MLYFKHKNIDLYSKFNEETGELTHMSVHNADFSTSLHVIEESQREFLKSELASNADPIEEEVFETAVTPIRLKLGTV